MSIETRLHAVEEYLKVFGSQTDERTVKDFGYIQNANANDLIETGLYHVEGTLVNFPKTNWGIVYTEWGGTPFQLYFPDATDSIFKRHYNRANNTWTNWIEIAGYETKILKGTNDDIWAERYSDGRMSVKVFFHTLTRTHYATWNNMYAYYMDVSWAQIGWSFKDTRYSLVHNWSVGNGYALSGPVLQRTTGAARVYALAGSSGTQNVTISVLAEGFWK